MLRCWEWSAEKRPTFENICNELPTLMPPLLVTVTDCRHKSSKENINYLNYEKGETIILLDKRLENNIFLEINYKIKEF